MPEPVQFTDSSPRFSLPFLFSGQAQKEFFVNEAHALTDILLHTAIEAEQASPPSSPLDGDAWLVSSNPTGDWVGHEDQIAARVAGGWFFISPESGMRIFDQSTAQFITYINGWQRPLNPLEPTGGQTVDTEARSTLADVIEALRIAGVFPVAG